MIPRPLDIDDFIGFIEDTCEIPSYIHRVRWYLRPLFLLLTFIQAVFIVVLFLAFAFSVIFGVIPILLSLVISSMVEKGANNEGLDR